MHTCEVWIEQIPKDADYTLTLNWWSADNDSHEFDSDEDDGPDEEDDNVQCNAPANKKLGYLWVCDLHYNRHADLEEDDHLAVIVEGGSEEAWAEEDATQMSLL